ncbi:MAG: (d)CMP kinase [Candidatus Stygibacter australis]|nr:(d)CMP kinase [Candidatus Stygibacter australis]MDP8322266.1 (d)CMP kinase [Candidatus Stygibacter australis]
MGKKYVIAIDGPAASGKSTTARQLAKLLHYVYIDSGAMYRACGLQTLLKGIKLTDLDSLKEMLREIEIRIEYAPEGNRIYLDDQDVSARIREADITRLASEIAVIGIVRERMVELQRKMGEDGGVIMDGRDIGTVVFTDADYKFFMVADVKTRALRRWQEAREKDEELVLMEVEQELLWRDKNDSTRTHSPLRQADDAILIDTSKMDIPEQVDYIYNIVREGKCMK